MKRLALILVGLTAAIWSMGAMAAGVGVVDMQQILQTSPEIKKINADLTKQFDERKQKIVEMGRALQGDLQTYQKNKSVMSAKVLTDTQEQIGKKEASLRDAQMKFQQDLFTAQNKSMNDFMDRVRGAVKDVAAKKQIDLVLPKNMVLYSQGATDITSDVMSKIQ